MNAIQLLSKRIVEAGRRPRPTSGGPAPLFGARRVPRAALQRRRGR